MSELLKTGMTGDSHKMAGNGHKIPKFHYMAVKCCETVARCCEMLTNSNEMSKNEKRNATKWVVKQAFNTMEQRLKYQETAINGPKQVVSGAKCHEMGQNLANNLMGVMVP